MGAAVRATVGRREGRRVDPDDVRRAQVVLRHARLDLREVLGGRTAHLEKLADWHGGHAAVHRRRTRALVHRGQLVGSTLEDLDTRLSVLLASQRLAEPWRLARERPPSTGGDPVVLRCAATEAAGHADVLDAAATAVGRAATDASAHAADTIAAATALRSLGQECRLLDRWLLHVADALERADGRRGALAIDLLGLGVDHPTRVLVDDVAAVRGRGWARVSWTDVPDRDLSAMLRWTTLPSPARDLLARELVTRWGRRLERAAAVSRTRAATDRSVADRLTSALDDRLLDPLDPVVTVHVDAEEEAGELARVARGLHAILALDGVLLLDARPGNLGAPTVTDPIGPTLSPAWRRGELAAPTLRLALGDPAAATHVAVLLAGTGTGVASHGRAIADARALHATLAASAEPGTRPAVVLELYDAPTDLARAADGRAAAVAASELARGLAALDLAAARTTIIGHSYGAVVAGRTAAVGADVDALVALGAPGLGVTTLAELGLPADEVWAARAAGDPIVLVGDVAAVARRVGIGGPLSDRHVAHGPDPSGSGFGARPLPTSAAGLTTTRGHLAYLDPGTASLSATAAVVLGLGM